MTTVWLFGEASSDPGLEVVRGLARARATVVSSLGADARADVVVAKLPSGARTVPDEVAVAASAAGARGLLLCTAEPLVRPINVLGAGNVLLLSATSRQHVATAFDLLFDDAAPRAGQQALTRDAWAAWSLGDRAAPLAPLLGEVGGITLVHAAQAAQQAEALRLTAAALATPEGRRKEALREGLGQRAAIVHLSSGANAWIVHWPNTGAHLWLYSAARLPMRWSLAAAIANSDQPGVRLPAFPGDLVVATSIRDERAMEVLAALPQGALDVQRALDRITSRPGEWGFVIEAK